MRGCACGGSGVKLSFYVHVLGVFVEVSLFHVLFVVLTILIAIGCGAFFIRKRFIKIELQIVSQGSAQKDLLIEMSSGYKSIELNIKESVASLKKDMLDHISSSEHKTIQGIERSSDRSIDKLNKELQKHISDVEHRTIQKIELSIVESIGGLKSELMKQTLESNEELLNALEGHSELVKSTSHELTKLKDVLLDGHVRVSFPVYHSMLNEVANEIKWSEDKALLTTKDGLVKHLIGFKISKIEDKNNNQTTEFLYENNKKVASETLEGNKLRYRMSFNEDEKPVLGQEFGAAGRVEFEYYYDAAGEIEKRIDYSENGSVVSETVY